MIKRKFKIFFLLSFLICNIGNAQSEKKVFIEAFSQASCGACLFYNFGFNDLLAENEDKVVALRYQIAWPETDQMNLDNPVEVDDRLVYYYGPGYDLSRIPVSTIDGNLIPDDCSRWEGCPFCLDQVEIDEANTPTSAFDLMVTGVYDSGTITITGSLTANENITGDLRLRMAIAEQTIYVEDIEEGTIEEGIPNSTSRELEFYDILKKFVGGSEGIDISDTWTAGETYTINETIDVSDLNIYEFTELEIVAFVQNDSNFEVLQAAKDDNMSLATPYQNNAALLRVVLTEEPLCIGEIATASARLKIRNGGNVEMTSADISISVNGSTAQIIPWTGNLAILESMYVEVPFLFAVADVNNVEVTILNPNGQADENSDDNTLSGQINYAQVDNNFVTLELFTDQWPDDTSWQFLDEAGNVLIEAVLGTYIRRLELNTHRLYMPSDGCYSFVINDVTEDGICCVGSTNGYYRIKDNLGNILFEGAEFGAGETNFITLIGGEVVMNNAIIIDYTSGEVINCEESSLTAVVTIQNQSSNTISSVDIESFANGNSLGVQNWSGSIEPFQTANVNLDMIELSEDTEMTYSITAVNDVEDVYAVGNDYSEIFKISADAANELTMTLMTDCFPEENTWSIVNSALDTVMQGGPYPGLEDTTVVESFTLPSNDCYEFIFTDSYGDGLYASQWNECSIDGSLTLVDAFGTTIYSNDGSYSLITIEVNYLNPASESVDFNYDMAVGITKALNEQSFSVNPNPSSGDVTVSFDLEKETDVNVTVHDMLGNKLRDMSFDQLNGGQHQQKIELSDLSNGVYILTLQTKSGAYSKKILVSK